MKINTISVFINKDEFKCFQNYSYDDIFAYYLPNITISINNSYIGYIPGLIIPDTNDENYKFKINKFNKKVELFLKENYYND